MATPMETFAAEAPDVAAAFDRLIEALVGADGLDARTKQIAYIAIKAAQGDAMAVALHVPMAKTSVVGDQICRRHQERA